MPLTTYNCTALTGGAARALDSYSVEDLADGDRAICAVGGLLFYFMFDATATDAEDVSSHPYKVRPDDYADQGVWIEQEAVINPVTADVVIADNRLVRGDGGAKGVQECSTISVSDDGEMVNTGQPCFLITNNSYQDNLAVGSPVDIIFNNEIFDIGNNVASNTFTAPVSGKYQLNVQLRLGNVDTAGGYYAITLTTSNRNYYYNFSPLFSIDAPYITCLIAIVGDMDINDTAKVTFYQEQGEVQTDIRTGTYFSGTLIC